MDMPSAAHVFIELHAKNTDMGKKNAAAVELGRKGGRATAKNLTVEQRIEAARKAAEARWAKTRELTKQITEGAKALLDKAQKRQAALDARKPKK